MSGLFCDDPRFLYRSPNDKFLLEVYEGGQVAILDLDRGTSTAFENMIQLDELKVILLLASNDQHERKRKSSWSSSDSVSEFVSEHDTFTHCEICEKAKDKEDMSWYVKQHRDGGHFMFMCLGCANSPEGVGFVQCDPANRDDHADIPF